MVEAPAQDMPARNLRSRLTRDVIRLNRHRALVSSLLEAASARASIMPSRPSCVSMTAAPPSNSCNAARRDGRPNATPSVSRLLFGNGRLPEAERRLWCRLKLSTHAARMAATRKTPPWRDTRAGKVHWVEIHAPGIGERGEVAATILFAAVVRTTGLKRAQRRDFFPIEPAKIPNLACATPFTAPRRA